MTVLIYVDTSKQVETLTTSRCSQTRMLRKNGSRRTIRKALRLSMRFWSEPIAARLPDLV
jgi:hypothetical protein